jgi:hypothetical protein
MENKPEKPLEINQTKIVSHKKKPYSRKEPKPSIQTTRGHEAYTSRCFTSKQTARQQIHKPLTGKRKEVIERATGRRRNNGRRQDCRETTTKLPAGAQIYRVRRCRQIF